MKMSFVWLIFTAGNISYVLSDTLKDDFGFWFYLNLVGAALSVYLYHDARQSEQREAEAKREFINIFINPGSNVSEEEVARAARKVINESGSKF